MRAYLLVINAAEWWVFGLNYTEIKLKSKFNSTFSRVKDQHDREKIEKEIAILFGKMTKISHFLFSIWFFFVYFVVLLFRLKAKKISRVIMCEFVHHSYTHVNTPQYNNKNTNYKHNKYTYLSREKKIKRNETNIKYHTHTHTSVLLSVVSSSLSLSSSVEI